MADMSEDQQKVLSQMEEMLIETFNTMKRACSEKCSNHKYKQTNLVKSEAVCMDRCVAKYMELHDLIGRRISRDKDTYDLLSRPPFQTNLEDTEAYKLREKFEKEQTGLARPQIINPLLCSLEGSFQNSFKWCDGEIKERVKNKDQTIVFIIGSNVGMYVGEATFIEELEGAMWKETILRSPNKGLKIRRGIHYRYLLDMNSVFPVHKFDVSEYIIEEGH